MVQCPRCLLSLLPRLAWAPASAGSAGSALCCVYYDPILFWLSPRSHSVFIPPQDPPETRAERLLNFMSLDEKSEWMAHSHHDCANTSPSSTPVMMTHGSGGGYGLSFLALSSSLLPPPLTHLPLTPSVGNVPANTRLGIPALNLNDGPQGFRGDPGTSTCWPSALT